VAGEPHVSDRHRGPPSEGPPPSSEARVRNGDEVLMGYPTKGEADFWAPGDWNAACSMCGAKKKASWLVRNWQGYYRCPDHNEPRQPQDFVRATVDAQTVPWAQPESDVYITFCTINGSSAIPDYAFPDCCIPDTTFII